MVERLAAAEIRFLRTMMKISCTFHTNQEASELCSLDTK